MRPRLPRRRLGRLVSARFRRVEEAWGRRALARALHLAVRDWASVRRREHAPCRRVVAEPGRQEDRWSASTPVTLRPAVPDESDPGHLRERPPGASTCRRAHPLGEPSGTGAPVRSRQVRRRDHEALAALPAVSSDVAGCRPRVSHNPSRYQRKAGPGRTTEGPTVAAVTVSRGPEMGLLRRSW